MKNALKISILTLCALFIGSQFATAKTTPSAVEIPACLNIQNMLNGEATAGKQTIYFVIAYVDPTGQSFNISQMNAGNRTSVVSVDYEYTTTDDLIVKQTATLPLGQTYVTISCPDGFKNAKLTRISPTSDYYNNYDITK